jgi:hypothetical protein
MLAPALALVPDGDSEEEEEERERDLPTPPPFFAAPLPRCLGVAVQVVNLKNPKV